ncbi:MAG: hypothetical protein QMD82_00975 [bacterium]|nr:hypothetical protein [bacterium]
MKKYILISIFLLSGFVFGFDLRSLLVFPKTKDATLEVNYHYTRNSKYISEERDLKVVYSLGNPATLAIFDGEKALGTIYYDNSGKVVKQEFQGQVYEGVNLELKGTMPDYKEIGKKFESYKGKSVLVVTSVREHSQEDTKGHLIMRTVVNSTKKDYYDEETGLLVRQEITTDVVQRTFTVFDKEKPLNERSNRITELLEMK